MPQTPSFFIPRGLLLYNLLAGQRFSLRSGAASATQPVGLNQPMAFIIDRADSVASMLEKFTTAHAYQVAGQYANIEFWITETLHTLDALADYDNRFERLAAAQREWVDAHNVVVGSYCPMCGGQCEFDPDLKPPRAPTKISSKGRDEAARRLKDAFYFFILRCFRMNLVDERTLRDTCSRVGTSVEARDLVRK